MKSRSLVSHIHNEGVVAYEGHPILLTHPKAVTGAANTLASTPEPLNKTPESSK